MTPAISVEVCNRQRTRRLNLALLRQMIRRLAAEWSGDVPNVEGKLCLHFVDASTMAELNGKFLGHAGSTDVITFDYREQTTTNQWCGEIFVSVDDAVACAPRYRASWQLELMRYVVHGMMHLRGYDDTRPALRRAMKREESRRLKELSRRYDLSRLERKKNAA